MTFSGLVAGSVHDAAPGLIGWTLLVDGVGGRIVEVEAYEETDPASHSFGGPRGRNVVMFGPPAHLYVYRSYGIHWCANVVCGPAGYGAAVLLRALEPTHGLEEMRRRRRTTDDRLLCSGPGRLTEALAITGALSGADLGAPPFVLVPPSRPATVARTTRIGITKAAEKEWRYVDARSAAVSQRPAAKT
ncbi:MAG: DNA-3-methyladenine glycosylase [Gaiella sp.]|nr:DNA-3-methyladenine glycosylase [Gaiella sp.]